MDTGQITFFADTAVPSGWLACDGSAVSRTTYAKLFTAIGETFGGGDGDTTFNVPDLRGRAPIGAGQGSGLTLRTLGDAGGEEEHQVTESELAAHTHDFNYEGLLTLAYISSHGAYNLDLSGTTGSTGGDVAHENMMPSLVLVACIRS